MAELILWLRTRVAQPRIALLWMLILAAVFASKSLADASDVQWPCIAAMAAFMLVQFRLWDDLADINYDSVHAPERALVGSRQLTLHYSVVWICAGFVATAFLYWQGWPATIAYFILFAFTGAVYRTLKSSAVAGGRRSLRTCLVLLKYPVFVLLLADKPLALHAFAAAAALFVCLIAYEFREESRRAVL